jgi:hypothetical protein
LRAPFGLVQTLPLRDSQVLLATDSGAIAASDHSIYRLLPVPIGVQVRVEHTNEFHYCICHSRGRS